MQLTREDSGADRSGNCHPGLVVDTELVHSRYLDFYLQSHAGILGSKCYRSLYPAPLHILMLGNSQPPQPLCGPEE